MGRRSVRGAALEAQLQSSKLARVFGAMVLKPGMKEMKAERMLSLSPLPVSKNNPPSMPLHHPPPPPPVPRGPQTGTPHSSPLCMGSAGPSGPGHHCPSLVAAAAWGWVCSLPSGVPQVVYSRCAGTGAQTEGAGPEDCLKLPRPSVLGRACSPRPAAEPAQTPATQRPSEMPTTPPDVRGR